MLYSVFGLYWQVDQPLPGLAILPDAPRVDLRLWLNSRPAWLCALRCAEQTPWYVSPIHDDEGRPVVTGWRLADGRHLRLVSTGGHELIVDERGTCMWVSGELPGLIDACFSWMIALVLRLRGLLCVHASAVLVDGVAFALVGPEGSGKSTLATALACRGYPVLADDLMVLPSGRDRCMVEPGLPWVRLRPSARPWLEAEAALPLVETADRAYLDLRADRLATAFWQRPAPLGGLWFLGPPREGPSIIRPRSARHACVALLGRSWATRLLSADQRAAELDQLTHLLSRVSSRELEVAATPAELDALCAALIADARAQLAATAQAA